MRKENLTVTAKEINKIMKTHTARLRHEKAIKILDCIEEAKKRIRSYKNDLTTYECYYFPSIKRNKENRIATTYAILDRLEQMYNNLNF